MRKFLLTLLTSAVLLLLPSFSQAQQANPEVTGTVTYRERVALPPDAVINVQLLDTSVADVAAQTVADVMLNGEGRQVPVPFTLTFDPAKIVPGNRYSVRATIRSGDGMLMFSTTQSYPVLTHGAPSKVNLILYRVGHGAKPTAAVKKPVSNSPSEPQAAAESASAKPLAPAATSEPAPPTVESSSPQNSENATSPVAAAPAKDAEGEKQGTAGQQIAVEPAAAPNTELTVPGSEPQTKDASSQPATPTEKSSSRAATPESTPPSIEPAPAAASVPEQQAAAAETPAPEPPWAQSESKMEEPPVTPGQAPPAEGTTEPTAPAPESKASEVEPPLPEAPSASKGIGSAMPSSDSATPDAAEPGSAAEPAMPSTALNLLANTQWKLIQLNGQDVVIGPTQKPVTLAFSPEGRRIAGSAGCNSFLGTYSDEHGTLKMHPGSMTMMFCPDPAGGREKKFIAVLRSVDGYKLSGDFLVLTTSGKIVAKFKTNPPL